MLFLMATLNNTWLKISIIYLHLTVTSAYVIALMFRCFAVTLEMTVLLGRFVQELHLVHMWIYGGKQSTLRVRFRGSPSFTPLSTVTLTSFISIRQIKQLYRVFRETSSKYFREQSTHSSRSESQSPPCCVICVGITSNGFWFRTDGNTTY